MFQEKRYSDFPGELWFGETDGNGSLNTVAVSSVLKSKMNNSVQVHYIFSTDWDKI